METAAAPHHTSSLYQRLGGSEAITMLVDDIVEAHMGNAIIKARFLPYAAEPERLGAIKGHLCAFLCAGSGGPQTYAGRTMPETHRGMNISAAEFVAAVDDILAVLGRHGLGDDVKKDVLAISWSLKDDIMGL